jgi:hypothetical protein
MKLAIERLLSADGTIGRINTVCNHNLTIKIIFYYINEKRALM